MIKYNDEIILTEFGSVLDSFCDQNFLFLKNVL